MRRVRESGFTFYVSRFTALRAKPSGNYFLSRQEAKFRFQTMTIKNRIAEVRPVYTSRELPRHRKAIEHSFPFTEISELAERQSWRRDVYQTDEALLS